MVKNIILVGLGPHARRIYYPLLEKYAKSHQLNLVLVVDVQDQQDKICAYLAGRPLQPEKLFFIESNQRNRPNLEGQLQAALDRLVLEQRLDGVIISTEAKAHKPYLLWAIERNLDVLVDKPIVALCGLTTHRKAARQIYTDYLEIEAKLRQSRSNVIVQCQRCSHPGYCFVKTYLTEFIQQYQIPLSYLDIYHADGMWCMPPELFERENHPYKYGYGKLMHSGYHFIDLWAWLVETNNPLESKKPTELDLVVKRFGPADFLHQVSQADYQRLLQADNYQPYFSPEMRQTAQQFGELDVYILGQLKRAGAVVTTATINLQQNFFSRRAWANPPEDVYKGNGRVRHERLNVQVGNLLNLQVHSYQAL